MEKFTKNYLVLARSILSHPYQAKLNDKSKLCLKVRNSKQVRIWQLFCAFIVLFLTWNNVLLLLLFKTYIANRKFLQLAFHMIWLVCSATATVNNLPNLYNSLGVTQLNNCINCITDNFETGKSCL